jgi:hypothetical protein
MTSWRDAGTTMSLTNSTTCAAMLLMIGAAPALAAPKPPAAGRAAAFQAMLDCRSLTDGAARLACYDTAAGRMDEAEAKGDIVVVDRALATTVHREAFGLPVPSLNFLTKMMQPGDVDRIDGIVRSARADAYWKWTVELESGAIWRQIDGDLGHPPHAGSKVTIRNGAIGSFLMNVDGQAAIRVHRDR